MPGVTPSISRIKNRDLGPTVTALDVYNTEDTATHKIGTRVQLGDRVFRYSKANATTALAAGFLCCGNAYITTCSTKTAHPAGTIVITLSGALAAANYYNEGYMIIANTGGAMGAGATYKIKESSSSVSSNFTVTLYDAIASACATSTTALVVRSLYDGVTVMPITQTETPVGVPLTDVSANAFCWLQTWGPVGIVSATNFGKAVHSRQLVVSASAAGTVTFDLTGNVQCVGYAYANTDAASEDLSNPVILTLNR